MLIDKNRLLTLIKILIPLLISLVITSFPSHYVESFFYDLRFRLNPFVYKSSNVITVAVDQASISKFEGQPNLKAHVKVLEEILKDEPLAIYYTIDPKILTGTSSDQLEFTKSLKKFKNYILYTDFFPNKGEEAKLIIGENFKDLKYSPGSLSHDNKHFAEDSVARRAVLTFLGFNFSQVIASNLATPITNFEEYRGSFYFLDTIQINVNYQPTGTYKPISFTDVYETKALKNSFKDKIVLIGIDTNFEAQDYFKTVYNRSSFAMSKLEAQANIIATLVNNNGIIKTHKLLNALITVLFSMIVVFSVFSLSPARGLVVILSTVGTYCLISWMLFSFFGVAIGMAQPLLAIFVCYYFFIPYRLIQENKKFWELTQKNKLLIQVEELKNNFLSMMSHDLKTPLARIQGMAEVALQKNSLDPDQKNAVVTIKKSAEELTEFISSILDLSRVESQQIKLHLQPKDVNKILEDCIRKLDYMAKEKNIEIVTEFEPIFSVKLDPDLMKQVFGNLIENAIKYSPEGSKVLVSTEEADGQIVIQVADQGIGISDNEIKNIFTKFYRTRDVKNSPIKGSGLGLYLAKYFVELHKGDISVESFHKEGSTFTVQLPMDL